MIDLYEHNLTAYKNAEDMLSLYGKAAVIHPTGTGKSFIAFRLCDDNRDKRVCWISPGEYIFKTQLENIKKANPSFDGSNITFLTYSALMLMGKAEMSELKPAFIILDEFHRAGAQQWGKGVRNLLSLYPDAKVLGLSATNIRYLDNKRDMADELFDGRIASNMTLGEAIVRGILTPPKYVLSVFSYKGEFERYSAKIGKIKNKAVHDRAEKYLDALKRVLENADGLDEIFRKFMQKDGKYIVFCSGVEHMREMIAKIPEWFSKVDKEPNVYCAYSDNPETSSAFADFKADQSERLKLLFCIDMLNEGIHIDGINGVILLRPTVSPIIYKQQIGRALSASAKDNAVIFDVVLNFENLRSINDVTDEMAETVDFYRELGKGSDIVNERFTIFDETRNCLEIFDKLERAITYSWDNMYAAAKSYYEKNGNLLPHSLYRDENGCNLGQWIVAQRIAHKNGTLSESRTARLERIGMSWLTLKQRQWESGFQSAERYYKTHGNLKPDKSEPQLYCWILNQRKNYKTGFLTPEQIRRLNGIGMLWETDDIWQIKFDAAKRYYDEHGNLDIPADFVTDDGLNLGRWHRNCIKCYADGTLSDERIKQLEQIGMNWNSVNQRTWLAYYDEAKRYYAENGDLNVNLHYRTVSGLNLGIWISGQRYSYSKKRLSKQQADLLEAIGMSWHRDRSRWQQGYDEAKKYYDAFGNLNPPSSYKSPDGFPLGAWIAAQRSKYSKGKLKSDCVQKLETLSIVWNANDAAWNSFYENLKEYRRFFGNCDVSNRYVTDTGAKLGSWCANQRTKYKNGKLTENQIAKLTAIGFKWNLKQNVAI